MGVDEFRIAFDNPSKSFFPGQNVTGNVIVSAPVEKKCQGLKIKFSGLVSVHWQVETTESTGSGDSRQTRKVIKHHTDSDNLFDYKVYVVGDGRTDVRIPPGRNVYPFNFALPSMNVPSSYEGEHGNVTYQVEATIKRNWKFDHDVKEKFTVNAIVDLNKDSGASQSVERHKTKNFCCLCCTSGPVGFLITVKRQGYVPGEYADAMVELENKSNRGINGVSVSLIQTATFFAHSHKKSSSKTVAEVKRPGVDPGDSDIWQPPLQIPPVPPSKLGGCRIIDVEYELKFELHVSGLGFNLKESIPIIIGTIPLQSTFRELTSTANSAGGGYPSSTNIGWGPTAPSAPPLYPEMPNPMYHDSFDFGPTPQHPTGIVENVAEAALDKVLPKKEEPFVPQYPTYGWILKPEVKGTL